jgi:hypothetical protein
MGDRKQIEKAMVEAFCTMALMISIHNVLALRNLSEKKLKSPVSSEKQRRKSLIG